MGVYKVVAEMPFQSGLPEDVSLNTFYFVSEETDPDTAEMDEIVTRLDAFYTDTPADADAGFSISDYLGIQISRTASAASFLFYWSDTIAPVDMDWGSPVRMTSWTVPAPVGSTGLPGEVAIALSYNADLTDVPETQTNPDPPPATIRPAARLRGRIFLGPLTTGAMSNEGANQDASVTSSLRENLCYALEALMNSNALTTWCLLSQVNASVHEIVGGYVDDAFDTQRRRGTKAEVRTAWPLA